MSSLAAPSGRQLVADVMDRLPPAVTMAEIAEELAILVALQQADADVEAGRVIPHEEVVRRSKTWTSK